MVHLCKYVLWGAIHHGTLGLQSTLPPIDDRKVWIRLWG